MDNSNGHSYAVVADAGIILSGSGGPAQTTVADPTMFGSITYINWTNSDVSQDGFGATSGIAVVAASTTSVSVGSWAVNSSGGLSTNTHIGNYTVGTLGNATKVRLIRYASNAWAIAAPGTAPNYVVARFSSTANLTAFTNVTVTGLQDRTNGGLWDAFLDPITANRIWVAAMDAQSGSTARLSRVSVDVGSGVSVAGSVTTDDTITNIGTTAIDIWVAVKEPKSSRYVDWLIDLTPQSSDSTNRTVGDYTDFYVPPGTPGAWTNPTAGQIVVEGVPITIAWGAATQGSYALTYTITLSDTSGNFGSGTVIASGVSATSYSWTPSLSLTPSNFYAIEVQADDGTTYSGHLSGARVSGTFVIVAPTLPKTLRGASGAVMRAATR
jgi:hypothetical protein